MVWEDLPRGAPKQTGLQFAQALVFRPLQYAWCILTYHFQEKIISHFSTALNRWISKHQCLSRHELHDYALDVGILASFLPSQVRTRRMTVRHPGWHRDGQSSSLLAGHPAIVAILPLDLDQCVQLSVAPWCRMRCHQPILCLFCNMLLHSVVMSLVFKREPLLGFSLSRISCVNVVGLLYREIRLSKGSCELPEADAVSFVTPLLCSSTALRLSSEYFLKMLMSVPGPDKNSLKGKL